MTCETAMLKPGVCVEPSVWDACCASSVAALVQDGVFLVDDRLKIVCFNPAFGALCNQAAGATVVGHSLGEVLKCRHAAMGSVCGTADACHRCGWFQAVQSCRAMGSGEQECRILSSEGRAYDFAVKVLPVSLSESAGAAWACSLKDLYAQKRLRVMEKVFFHDVTNLAVGVRGITELFGDPAEDTQALHAMLHDGACRLVFEIDRLRTLRVAENGDVRVWNSPQAAGVLLRTAIERYEEEADSHRLRVQVEPGLPDVVIETDQELFQFVFGELLLNAIEASGRDETVTLGYAAGAGKIVFSVRNVAVMEPAVQAHVFERSFTTKGAGRGVGAYRAKLLAERFLKGSVWFTSREPEGTVFCLSLPLESAGKA